VNVHKKARCTPRGRSLAVQRVAAGESPGRVAHGVGMSRQTPRKWTRRAEAAGDDRPAALVDRSSRPKRLARQLPRHQRRQILRSRRKRWSSLRIAQHYALAVSTVVSFLRRHGLNRLARLEPPRPIQRYERRRPGTLVHLDVKKLGKIGRVGHRMHGDARRASAASAGSTCTSRSMIAPAWATPRCSPTNRPSRRSAYSSACMRGTPPKASRCADS